MKMPLGSQGNDYDEVRIITLQCLLNHIPDFYEDGTQYKCFNNNNNDDNNNNSNDNFVEKWIKVHAFM